MFGSSPGAASSPYPCHIVISTASPLGAACSPLEAPPAALLPASAAAACEASPPSSSSPPPHAVASIASASSTSIAAALRPLRTTALLPTRYRRRVPSRPPTTPATWAGERVRGRWCWPRARGPPSLERDLREGQERPTGLRRDRLPSGGPVSASPDSTVDGPAAAADQTRPKRRILLGAASRRRCARYLATEAGCAGLLLAATVVALLWANSPWSDAYDVAVAHRTSASASATGTTTATSRTGSTTG